MQVFKYIAWAIGLFALVSCEKKIDRVYEVNTLPLSGAQVIKNKPKSAEQYISVLYNNLFQQSLPANQLIQLSECMQSMGDQAFAREVLVSNLMNRSGVQLPTMQQMRNAPEAFVDAVYQRFLIRMPTEAERTWFVNFIQARPQLTPEHVYLAFAICEEYQFY